MVKEIRVVPVSADSNLGKDILNFERVLMEAIKLNNMPTPAARIALCNCLAIFCVVDELDVKKFSELVKLQIETTYTHYKKEFNAHHN